MKTRALLVVSACLLVYLTLAAQGPLNPNADYYDPDEPALGPSPITWIFLGGWAVFLALVGSTVLYADYCKRRSRRALTYGYPPAPRRWGLRARRAGGELLGFLIGCALTYGLFALLGIIILLLMWAAGLLPPPFSGPAEPSLSQAGPLHP